MSDYVFPYWDDMDYWIKNGEKTKKSLDDDSPEKQVED